MRVWMVTRYCCGHDEIDSLWSTQDGAEARRDVCLADEFYDDWVVDEYELDVEV